MRTVRVAHELIEANVGHSYARAEEDGEQSRRWSPTQTVQIWGCGYKYLLTPWLGGIFGCRCIRPPGFEAW